MKRSINGLLFIFLLQVVFFSPMIFGIELKGTVVSLEGNVPVSQVVVLHRDSQANAVTDERGQFVLDVPEDPIITLILSHPDYLEEIANIRLDRVKQDLQISLVPYIRQREEVVVTALRYPESSISVPAAETVVNKENLQEKMPSNLAKSIERIPGVSNIGAGGFSIVPNIRGLARRRILLLMDYARITSERRTGPSASFVNPRDIEKIEVLRSSSSVLYGSDAIGGVIHILTKSPPIDQKMTGGLHLQYATVNQEKSIGLQIEGGGSKIGYFLSFQAQNAKEYRSPQGIVPQSHFTQGSLLGKMSYQTEKRDITLSFLGSRGYDIGKANANSDKNPTNYPLENQNFFQLQWKEKKLGNGGELTIQTYLNPHALETKKERLNGYKINESMSRTQSLDFGAHLSYGKKMGDFRLSFGTDFYGRFSAKSENSTLTFDASGKITSTTQEWPYQKGNRNDIGAFISLDYMGFDRVDILSGVRFDFLSLQAQPGGSDQTQKSQNTALTGFIGSSWKIWDPVVLFINLSRAYRVPSLNELFYSGITGRGTIISQPDLSPETSINLDGGAKLFLSRFFAGIYIFRYQIDDLIERYLVGPRLFTYGNIDRGQISGYEVEVEWYPRPGWKLFANHFSFHGQSKINEEPLNDIPPPRWFAGTKIWLGRFIFELNATFQNKKDQPGPAEISIPAYEIVNFEAGYSFGNSFRIQLIISNLFNRSYLARPDPDSVLEPGRSLLLGISTRF